MSLQKFINLASFKKNNIFLLFGLVTFTTLSSVLLNCFFASSNLLLIYSSVFFILVIVFFIYE